MAFDEQRVADNMKDAKEVAEAIPDKKLGWLAKQAIRLAGDAKSKRKFNKLMKNAKIKAIATKYGYNENSSKKQDEEWFRPWMYGLTDQERDLLHLTLRKYRLQTEAHTPQSRKIEEDNINIRLQQFNVDTGVFPSSAWGRDSVRQPLPET